MGWGPCFLSCYLGLFGLHHSMMAWLQEEAFLECPAEALTVFIMTALEVV